MYTIEGHAGSVNCCRIADTKLISGDENGLVIVRDFLHNGQSVAQSEPVATGPLTRSALLTAVSAE
eukprot:jgi/Hompol1/5067/HPOL_004135-RA